MAKKIGNYLWRLFTLLLFVAVSALTLFFAYGYQFDLRQRDLKKTSIIDVTAKEDKVRLLLDGTQQADALPYQIKNVEPARHILTIRKEGFLPWARSVQVEEDIVSIVNDVLLVPDHIEDFISSRKDFPDDEDLIAGDRYLLSFERGDKILKITGLFQNGTLKDEEIELYRDGLSSVEPLPKETLMLSFEDGSVAWTDFRNRRFRFFQLPKGSSGVKVNPENQTVYFLLSGDLYGVSFAALPNLKKDAAAFKIRENVSVYAPVMSGDLYVLSNGTLFRMNALGREMKLVDQDPGNYRNLGYVAGKDYGALLLRDEGDRRILCLLGRNGSIRVLENNLKGQPFFNDYDQLLYADTEGVLHFFDPNVAEEKIAGKIDGDFEILGWFSDEGHFLVKKGSVLELRDVFDANTTTLLADTGGISDFFVLNKALFYLKDGVLYGLYWQKAV